jgi:hypothetical protein
MKQLVYRLLFKRCQSCIAYKRKDCSGARSRADLHCGRGAAR